MTREELIGRVGACAEGIGWLARHQNMTDREAWYACDRPEFLRWVLEVAHQGTDTSQRVDLKIRPIWTRYVQAGIRARIDRDEACGYAATDEERQDIEGAYLAAIRVAEANCCAMIRATVAMPTRQMLVDLLERHRAGAEAVLVEMVDLAIDEGLPA